MIIGAITKEKVNRSARGILHSKEKGKEKFAKESETLRQFNED